MTPTPLEREIVAEMLISTHELIGSVDDIWGHPAAGMAFQTLRRAIEAIEHLYRSGRSLSPSRIRATIDALSLPGDPSPFMLTETIDHLLNDPKARAYWDGLMPDSSHPHVCPLCGGAAFVGYIRVECKRCGDH